MGSQQFDEKEIFNTARKIDSPQARADYLKRACGDDQGRRNRIATLLRMGEDGPEFLESPAVTVAIDQAPAEQVGAEIGPYTLVEEIGEGGMGVVYLAKQLQPVRRKVALKIIKPGMDSKQVVSRFEAERQALAMMDHPCIARVIDGGSTESGRPYFVMELVNGMPVTDYCDRYRFTTDQRLELFIQVCQAVQHAHQKGIIHRDLKPSNILVTHLDGRAVPKVIDFGVAKAISGQLTDRSTVTHFSQMIGTPLYMSPEQAELSGQDIDTRSDVYSLGVLLYELLTGATPFDRQRLKEVSPDEFRRIIQEEEPPRPSARLSTLDAALDTVAEKHQTDPRTLSRRLSGELDWIVMRALEKDRNRRYESASAFAADVKRYLNDEPVAACPPSLSYQFRKFTRRNRVALTTSAVVAVAVLVGTGVSIWQAHRATNEARRATAAEQLASRRLEQVDEQRKLAETQRQRAEANVQLALDALDQVYLPLVEAEFAEKIELTERDREFLEKTLPFYEMLAAQKTDDPQAQYAKARAYLRVGNIYRSLHALPDEKDKKAEEALRQAIELFEELATQDPSKPEYHKDLADSYRALGELLHERQPEEAEQAYRRSIAVYENVVDDLDPEDMLGVYRALGDLYTARQQWQQALVNLNKEISIRPPAWWLYKRRATAFFYLEQYDKALADIAQAVELDPGDISNLMWVNTTLVAKCPDENFRKGLLELADRTVELNDGEPGTYVTRGYLKARLGNLDDALADYERGIEATGDLGLRAQHYNNAAWYLATSPQSTPRHVEKAIQWVEKAIELEGSSGAPASLYQSSQTFNLMRFLPSTGSFPPSTDPYFARGSLYAALEMDDRAQADFDKFIERLSKPIQETPDDWFAWNQRGAGYHNLGHHEDAIADFSKAIELKPDGAKIWENRGRTYAELGRCSEAAADFSKAIELKADDWSAWNLRGIAYHNLGHHEKAAADFSKAIELIPDDAKIWANRGQTYAELGRWDEAVADCAKAIELKLDEPSVWNSRGAGYLGLGRHEEAAADFSKAIELNPDEAKIWGNRGRTYAELDRWTEAADDFSEAIELKADNWLLWYERGVCYLGLGRHEEAIADFSKAIELNPDDANTWAHRGCTYAKLGRWDEAAADFSKAMEVEADVWSVWNLRGVYYDDLGRHEEAIADYSKAIELNPDEAHVWANRGVPYVKLGRLSEAAADFSKAIELKADDWFFWNQRGIAYHTFGRHEEAIADFSKAIELKADDAQVWENRGSTYAELGRWSEAVADFAKAIELGRASHSNSYRHAMLCLASQDPDGYANACTGMLDRFAQSDDALEMRFAAWTCALAPDAVDDYSPVIELARRAVEVDPTFARRQCLGAVLYRADQFDEAMEILTSIADSDDSESASPAYGWYFLAMTHHHLGNDDPAREFLDRANQRADRELNDAEGPAPWNRRLTLELLRTDAETLIGDREAPTNADDNQPPPPSPEPMEN